jgi:hypothetical protein
MVSQTVIGNDKAGQSGEILRGVIRTNSLASQTEPQAESSHSPVTKGTTVQTTERGEMTRYWQKVVICHILHIFTK